MIAQKPESQNSTAIVQKKDLQPVTLKKITVSNEKKKEDMKEFDLGDIQLEANNVSFETTAYTKTESKENCSYVQPEEETF